MFLRFFLQYWISKLEFSLDRKRIDLKVTRYAII